MNFDKKALVGFITEIEASRDRAKGETRHQSEIFKKAREKGFEPKAMRQVLQRRAMKAGDRERMDELLDLYEHAMGALAEAVDAVQSGMSAREASERFGVSRGSLGAVVGGTKNAISEPPHDADGVVTETQKSCGADIEQPATDDGRGAVNNQGGSHETDVRSHHHLSTRSPAIHSEGTNEENAAHIAAQSTGESHDTRRLTAEPEVARVAPPDSSADEAPAPPSVGAVADASVSEGPRVAPNNPVVTPHVTPDLEMPPIPPFLIRAKQERAA